MKARKRSGVVARWTTVLGVAGLGGGVMGQGPSFGQFLNVPPLSWSFGTAVSPNGRYIVGQMDHLFFGTHDIVRYDRWTGQQLQVHGFPDHFLAAVTDSGLVWGNRNRGTVSTVRVLRWTPETGELYYAPGSNDPDAIDTVERVSADGQWGMGVSRDGQDAPRYPALYDLRLTPPLRVPIDCGAGNTIETIAGVTQPVGGSRFAFGTAVGNSTRTGLAWFVANAVGMPLQTEVYDVSIDGSVTLAKVGVNYFVRGDGVDRNIVAPIFPIIMSDPKPVRMSQDGSVVVGTCVNPTLPAGNYFGKDPMIWRKGRNPTSLRDMLTSVGVGVPAWNGAIVTGVSGDGSVVVGYYEQASGDQLPRDFFAVLPAANDTCQTARAVTYGLTIDSTNGATRAGGAVTCASEGAAPDVWFSFVPVANESVTIDTCGSSYDTTLAVYGGSCASLGNPLACNDDAVPACSQLGTNSRVSLSVFAGSTYYIRVSGWNGAYGSIQLNITAPARPANDNCSQATNMNPGSGWFWSNANAITDARPNCPGAGTPFNDLWYRTTPNETGRMTYSTCGSSINTVMAVYPGSACGDVNIPAIACVNSNGACGGAGSYITVPCVAGQPQLVRMGGMFGATGNGQITARFACDANVLNNYAVAVVNSGARAYWRFEDSGVVTAADTIRGDPFTCGNYPGTYTGLNTRRRGAQGLALNLSGAGHVWADTVPAARVGDTTLCAQTSLEAWVKTTDPNAGVIMTNRNEPGQTSLTMVVGFNPIGVANTAGKAMFVIDGPGVFYGAISTSRIDDGRWHHIVGRRIPRSFGLYTYYIYVDGVQEGTSNIGGATDNNNAPGGANWYIGNGPAWNSFIPGFNGSIDEAAIYCRALPPTEINNHYTLGRPCPADLDDGSGTGNPDGGVTVDDLLYYLFLFGDGSLDGDLDDGSGTGRRDGGVTIDDLLYFLLRYEGGC